MKRRFELLGSQNIRDRKDGSKDWNKERKIKAEKIFLAELVM